MGASSPEIALGCVASRTLKIVNIAATTKVNGYYMLKKAKITEFDTDSNENSQLDGGEIVVTEAKEGRIHHALFNGKRLTFYLKEGEEWFGRNGIAFYDASGWPMSLACFDIP